MAKTKATPRRRQNVILRLLSETRAELRKVNWPTRQEATQLTIIVLVVVAFTSALLGVMDFLFTRLFGFIVSLG